MIGSRWHDKVLHMIKCIKQGTVGMGRDRESLLSQTILRKVKDKACR